MTAGKLRGRRPGVKFTGWLVFALHPNFSRRLNDLEPTGTGPTLAPMFAIAGRIAVGLALALVITACGGGGSTTTAGVSVAGRSPGDFYQITCAACHGPDRGGLSGPGLTPDLLFESDAFYALAIREGRPALGMPAWGPSLTEPEIAALIDFLRSEGGGSSPSPLADSRDTFEVDLGALPQGAAVPFEWIVTNPGPDTIVLQTLDSPTLSVFLLEALPITLEPEESRALQASFAFPTSAEPGQKVTGVADARITGGGSVAVVVTGTVQPPARTLTFAEVSVPAQPVRLASWERYVFVGYVNGLIDVFEFTGPSELSRVERVESVARTPNHGPDGTPQPEVGGRLIGGMAVDDAGTLYVSHSDPRLNEGEFSQTGHLADLDSGMVTALTGPPGSYGTEGHRTDLISGLPRNVTNHVPLGVAVRDGDLFVAVGAMTDSGVPDGSKPDPDTGLSGAVLRLDIAAASDPIILTRPGAGPAGIDALVPGTLELWATGVRNGFGLAFGPEGGLYLTDQGSDGGGVPAPGPNLDGFGSHFGPDHLHLVTEGAFLGQPNPARGERILDDGSDYPTPVPNPGYEPPIHAFGLHESATGIAQYRGSLHPELDGRLLVAKFSGSTGLLALEIDGGTVVAVDVLTTPPARFGEGNLTDVAVGPDGQIVIAAFWDLRLLVSTGWSD